MAGHSQIEFLRIENLSQKPAPEELDISWLNADKPITVPHATRPGFSYAQEPYTVRLPDGRLLVVMRTNTGHVWYSVSTDQGETWRKTEPLCDRDGGEPEAITLGTGLRLSERNLGSEGPGPEAFDISPEGDEIAFVADSDPTGTDTNFDVYLIPLTGGDAIKQVRAVTDKLAFCLSGHLLHTLFWQGLKPPGYWG